MIYKFRVCIPSEWNREDKDYAEYGTTVEYFSICYNKLNQIYTKNHMIEIGTTDTFNRETYDL